MDPFVEFFEVIISAMALVSIPKFRSCHPVFAFYAIPMRHAPLAELILNIQDQFASATLNDQNRLKTRATKFSEPGPHNIVLVY